MDGNNTNSPFYNHGNNSTSSTLQFIPGTNSTSQVSSVGFNNLKKVNTNASQTSTASTVTNRNNPITRLFTKNRSNSIINPLIVEFDDDANDTNNSDEDNTSTTSTDVRKSMGGGMFKFSKNKLKFSNKNNSSKPDLTIQTGGHHGLKVPKKILSSSLLDDTLSPTGHGLRVPKKILNSSYLDDSPNMNNKRKNSASSPASTFHNFFHRSHNNSQPSKDQQIIPKDELLSLQQTINNNPNRTAMSLSSNNSNSFITDINFALVYNFTDPDYSVEEYDHTGEHTSFLDIHKKLMVPTDQYLQNKLHKHQTQEVGLGIISDSNEDNDYLSRYLIDFGKSNVTFFNNLISIMKPLFQPSQQKRLSNKASHPYLGIALEDISNYIKDNYVSESSVTPSGEAYSFEKPLGSRLSKSRSKTKFYTSNSSSTLSIGETVNNVFDEFKIREISQDLLTFFIKCMVTFQKDFKVFEAKSRNKSSTQIENGNIQSLSKQYINDWIRISEQWTYFNQKIRYYVMGIFHPLQKHLHDIAMQRYNNDPDSVLEVEIENVLLLAFRDVIIVPFLIQRKREYQNMWSSNQAKIQEANNTESPSHVPSYTFLVDADDNEDDIVRFEEERALQGNKMLYKNLINCFGILLTHTHDEVGNSDGEQHVRNNIFSETFTWLSKLG